MSGEERAAALADLLAETGRQHHRAFADTDGADPEWALWYADHLAGRIDSLVDAPPTKSKIIQCLMNAAEAHAAQDPEGPWSTFYANYLLGLGPAGMSTGRTPT